MVPMSGCLPDTLTSHFKANSIEFPWQVMAWHATVVLLMLVLPLIVTLEPHNLLYGTGISRVVPGPGMLCFGTNATMFDAASINVNSTAYFPGFEATGVHG